MKSLLAIFALLSISNVWAEEIKCTPDQVKQETIEFLKGMSNYDGDEGKITMEDAKIGRVMAYPDFDHPTHYYIVATMREEMTTKEGNIIKTENGMNIFWYDAKTCENVTYIFDNLEPINLKN